MLHAPPPLPRHLLPPGDMGLIGICNYRLSSSRQNLVYRNKKSKEEACMAFFSIGMTSYSCKIQRDELLPSFFFFPKRWNVQRLFTKTSRVSAKYQLYYFFHKHISCDSLIRLSFEQNETLSEWCFKTNSFFSHKTSPTKLLPHKNRFSDKNARSLFSRNMLNRPYIDHYSLFTFYQ